MEAVYTIILCIITLLLLYKYLTRNFVYWKRKGVPFVKPQFLFGNFYDIITFKKTIGHKLAEMYNEMSSPYFGMWIFNRPHFVVKSPELIKQVLVKDFKYFQDRTIASNEEADELIANILFVIKSPNWKVLRSNMTPAFTSGKIKNMLPLINKAGDDLRSYLSNTVLKHDFLDAKEACTKYATDVITSCVFGVDASCFNNEKAPWREIGKDMSEFTFYNGFRGTSYFFLPKMVDFFKLKFISNDTASFMRKAFHFALEERQIGNVKRNDLIDILIKMKKEVNFGEYKFEGDKLIAQAAQFFIGGFETTSSTIAHTLYELCLDKSIQKKLIAEIKTILEAYNGVTYEAVQSMKYLHKVILETLRKYPVLPFLDRTCSADYQVPGTDIILDKGTPVYIPMFGLHYDPEYYPNPNIYDPERFSSECINSRPPFAYIPFGSGPRNCIGERFGLISSKIGLVHILSQFEVETCKKTPVPIEFEPRSFFLASKTGLPMKFIDMNGRTTYEAQ